MGSMRVGHWAAKRVVASVEKWARCEVIRRGESRVCRKADWLAVLWAGLWVVWAARTAGQMAVDWAALKVVAKAESMDD